MNKSNTNKRNFRKKNGGFALYYAVLFAGILLIIGSSMINVALKGYVLAASIQESLKAFYAADSGMDCALYWGLHYNSGVSPKYMFPITTADGVGNISQIRCNNAAVSSLSVSSTFAGSCSSYGCVTTSYNYNVSDNSVPTKFYCVNVSVVKKVNQIDTKTLKPIDVTTTISTLGSNVSCSVTTPRSVERGLTIQF